MTRIRASELVEGRPSRDVRDFMSAYLETIQATDSIQNAAGRMRAFDLGCLLVRDDQELVGMITDRDITTRVAAAGKNPRTTAVSEVMSPGLLCIGEDQDVAEVARMMEVNQLHRLMLIDLEGHPSGIVSLGDLARNGHEDLAARVLIAMSNSVSALSATPWLR
jgi:CBS domain-containing protein